MTTYTQAAREWVRPTTEAAELTAAEIERIKASMPDIPYPVELLADRRASVLADYRHMTEEQQAEARSELAELACEMPNVTEEEDARLSRPFPY